jgi:hypothetical protein
VVTHACAISPRCCPCRCGHKYNWHGCVWMESTLICALSDILGVHFLIMDHEGQVSGSAGHSAFYGRQYLPVERPFVLLYQHVNHFQALFVDGIAMFPGFALPPLVRRYWPATCLPGVGTGTDDDGLIGPVIMIDLAGGSAIPDLEQAVISVTAGASGGGGGGEVCAGVSDPYTKWLAYNPQQVDLGLLHVTVKGKVHTLDHAVLHSLRSMLLRVNPLMRQYQAAYVAALQHH